MVLLKFMFYNFKFVVKFVEVVQNVYVMVQVFVDLFENYIDVEWKVQCVFDFEYEGDWIISEVINLLVELFIVLFDCEDILVFNVEFDDFVDDMEEVVSKFSFYCIECLLLQMVQFVCVVEQQCVLFVQGMLLIEDGRMVDELCQFLQKICVLEDEGDCISDEVVWYLYDGVIEVLQMIVVMCLGEIFNLIENVFDQVQWIVCIVESILFKNV